MLFFIINMVNRLFCSLQFPYPLMEKLPILQGFQYFSSLPVLHYLQVVFLLKFEHFHEYLIQHSLKLGGTKDHFKQVKIPGTAHYWKAWIPSISWNLSKQNILGTNFSVQNWQVCDIYTQVKLAKMHAQLLFIYIVNRRKRPK